MFNSPWMPFICVAGQFKIYNPHWFLTFKLETNAAPERKEVNRSLGWFLCDVHKQLIAELQQQGI